MKEVVIPCFYCGAEVTESGFTKPSIHLKKPSLCICAECLNKLRAHVKGIN